MRVLLIQSYLGRKGVADQLVYPIGLSCIATALAEAGHEPWIVDLNVGQEEPYERLKREIREFQPDAVGVSQRNIDSTTRKAPFIFHTQLKPTLDAIREAAPNNADNIFMKVGDSISFSSRFLYCFSGNEVVLGELAK